MVFERLDCGVQRFDRGRFGRVGHGSKSCDMLSFNFATIKLICGDEGRDKERKEKKEKKSRARKEKN